MTLLNTVNYSYNKRRSLYNKSFFKQINKNLLTDIDMSSI